MLIFRALSTHHKDPCRDKVIGGLRAAIANTDEDHKQAARDWDNAHPSLRLQAIVKIGGHVVALVLRPRRMRLPLSVGVKSQVDYCARLVGESDTWEGDERALNGTQGPLRARPWKPRSGARRHPATHPRLPWAEEFVR